MREYVDAAFAGPGPARRWRERVLARRLGFYYTNVGDRRVPSAHVLQLSAAGVERELPGQIPELQPPPQGHLLARLQGAGVPMRDWRRKAAYAIVAGVVAIVCQEGTVHAADVQAFRFGKDLVSDCVGRDLDFCTGYIAGAVDLMSSLYAVTGNSKFHACQPPGMTPTDLAKVVVAFIDDRKSYGVDTSPGDDGRRCA